MKTYILSETLAEMKGKKVVDTFVLILAELEA